MKTMPLIIRAALTFCLIASCLLLGQMGIRAMPIPGISSQEDIQKEEALRQAGLHGDRVKTPAMVAWLAKSPAQSVTITTLHALAELGATEALPTVDAVAHANNDPYLTTYFPVERARLLAEDSVRNIKDGKTRAREKIARFYQELNLTPQQLGPMADLYESHRGPWSHPLIPVEVYAMREIADMVYHGSFKDYADVPGVAQVDFQHDYAAWIKMKMAPLSPKDQATWLVNDLSHKRALTGSGNEDCEMHLAAELGVPAGEAAAATLEDVKVRQSEYTAAGVEALLSIVSATSNPASQPLHDYFKNNANPNIANEAQVGGGVERIAGY